MKKNVAETLRKVRQSGCATGAFNIFNYISAQGVIEAANELERPAIIQTSTGTVKRFGVTPLIQMLRPLMDNSKQSIFLNLDHCTSLELAKECVDAGWDMVMYDGSKLSFQENIRQTQEIVSYASKRGACVEGELGTIEGQEEDIISQTSQMVTLKECQEFVKESGVHIFAPSVGTAHGVYSGIPNLNFELVREFSESGSVPVVIHGGTGLSEADFKQFIQCGACKINISTALKQAYFDSMKEYLEKDSTQYKPLDADEYIKQAIKKAAMEHMNMFRV